MSDGGPPPGWLDDPDDPERERYWDGSAWTEHRRRAGEAQATTAGPPVDEPAGEAPAGKKQQNSGCLGAIILVVVLSVLFGMCSDDEGDDGAGGGGRDRGDDIAAYVMCQQFVEDRLKAPATAGFPLSSDANISGGPTTWTIRSHVDAENGFGAQIRTQFTCRVSYQGNDRWQLNELTME